MCFGSVVSRCRLSLWLRSHLLFDLRKFRKIISLGEEVSYFLGPFIDLLARESFTSFYVGFGKVKNADPVFIIPPSLSPCLPAFPPTCLPSGGGVLVPPDPASSGAFCLQPPGDSSGPRSPQAGRRRAA